ncbi:transmembrane protein 252-like [Pungitius pungitius]|uniref:transmembrane protein 252-like n=1 Tax=Pungitius pungitius TaxID=134920 RepID=UPI002E0DCFB0
MNVRKQLWPLARMVVPGVGFAITCIGTYVVSLQTDYGCTLRVISAYVMVAIGLLVVLTGVFWNICNSMKTKMYHRGGHEQHLQIYAIDRSSFPPSYEESQGSRQSPDAAPEFEVVVDGVDVAPALAPPLYSPDGSEAPDCTWSWEQPPLYIEVERAQRGKVDA